MDSLQPFPGKKPLFSILLYWLLMVETPAPAICEEWVCSLLQWKQRRKERRGNFFENKQESQRNQDHKPPSSAVSCLYRTCSTQHIPSHLTADPEQSWSPSPFGMHMHLFSPGRNLPRYPSDVALSQLRLQRNPWQGGWWRTGSRSGVTPASLPQAHCHWTRHPWLSYQHHIQLSISQESFILSDTIEGLLNKLTERKYMPEQLHFFCSQLFWSSSIAKCGICTHTSRYM